jgi:ATP-dependent DNA ligase
MPERRRLVEELASLRLGAGGGHPWAGAADSADAADAAKAAAASTAAVAARSGATAEQRLPGGNSRWSAGKDLSWVPLVPERVCEVKYDHLQGDRFRHATTFVRWRPDKPASACRYDQLEVATPFALEQIFRL